MQIYNIFSEKETGRKISILVAQTAEIRHFSWVQVPLPALSRKWLFYSISSRKPLFQSVSGLFLLLVFDSLCRVLDIFVLYRLAEN